MGINFSPKAMIKAISEAVIKSTLLQQGYDLSTADLLSKTGSAALDGFSYEKKPLLPFSKLRGLISNSIGDIFANYNIRLNKTDIENVVDGVFSIAVISDIAISEDPIAALVGLLEEFDFSIDSENLCTIAEGVIYHIHEGIRNDTDLLELDTNIIVHELLERTPSKMSDAAEKDHIPALQNRFLARFQDISSSGEDFSIAISDAYVPNRYNIDNKEDAFDDLLLLIDKFANHEINSLLKEKQLYIRDKITALIIFAHQCSGKSTLISKILAEHYGAGYIENRRIYLVCFSEKAFRKELFCLDSILRYLSISSNELRNSLLVVDALDEADLSPAEALTLLEELIYDLQELNCNLIVTSRPKYIFTGSLRSSLEITLLPFSIGQAKTWLHKVGQSYSINNIEEKLQQINSLTTDIKNVILLPYVLQMCIIYDISMSEVTELAKLYDLLFSGQNSEFAMTKYNHRPLYKVKEWEVFINEITGIAKNVFQSEDGAIDINDLPYFEEQRATPEMIKTEFLLYRKEENKYTFVHDSIPNYFVAKHLFIIASKRDYELLISELRDITGDKIILPNSVTDFVEYFVRSNCMDYSEFAIGLVKYILSLEHIFSVGNENFQSIQNSFFNVFVNSIRFAFAFIAPNMKPFTQFDLFGILNDIEQERFVQYTSLGVATLDCIKICSFENKSINDINISGTNLSGKNMMNMSMQNAKFRKALLSGAYLSGTDFTLALFDEARCHNADFTNSILFGASFRNAYLNGTNFSGANLENADLRGARIMKTKFAGAKLKGMKILVEQLKETQEIDLHLIRENKISVYNGDCLVPDSLLDMEYRNQRPVAYALYHDRMLGKNDNNDKPAASKQL